MTDENYTPRHASKNKALLSNEAYDFVLRLTKYVLPGLGTLYFTLAGIWNFPYAEQVVGTIVAVEAFLGVLLAFAKRSYEQVGVKYDGELIVDTKDPKKDVYTLDLHRQLEDVATKKELTLKVTPPGN